MPACAQRRRACRQGENEFGVANLIVYTDVGASDRAALTGARLTAAQARGLRRVPPLDSLIRSIMSAPRSYRKIFNINGVCNQSSELSVDKL
jgi:hypothetical protein